MFRIRKIFDHVIPINQYAITQVQSILRAQFHFIREDEVLKLPDKLSDPLKHGFRSILFVADDEKGAVKGFAIIQHEPVLNFCFLDFISAAPRATGRGLGGALYERVCQEALALNCIGLFFECLPDGPALSRDPEIRRQNVSRLKFYEHFGVRPITNTLYEMPLDPSDDNPPHLMFDDLGQERKLSRKDARRIVKLILGRKYKDICPPDYIERVIRSFTDDPVKFRPYKYVKQEIVSVKRKEIPQDQKIVLVINDRHDIHHVRERGYVESPIRIKNILREIEKTGLFIRKMPQKHPEKYLRSVHDSKFVHYLRTVCQNIPPGQSVYPYVFPIRNSARPPKILSIRAGYYCIDTFTPLNQNAYLAAKRAADCALTSVKSLLQGSQIAYALVRPPGHHAEWNNFGGFCYFNSNAIAAEYLSHYGKVTILDIDYHHGNGQQDIFYQRSDVLTLSIHGHPRFAYPYFSGFEDEKGFGMGQGYNVNYPLSENVRGEKYRAVLEKALGRIRRFKSDFIIIALGLDTAKGDPTGSWHLTAQDFQLNGFLIGSLKIPTLVVQEGGYNQRNIGVNARHFFSGLWQGYYNS